MCDCKYIFKPLYRIHEVEDLLGIGKTLIYKLVDQGKLIKVVDEKITWITGASIRTYISSLRPS
jgi:predicted DNA-binding transcriptional regulator AlpA